MRSTINHQRMKWITRRALKMWNWKIQDWTRGKDVSPNIHRTQAPKTPPGSHEMGHPLLLHDVCNERIYHSYVSGGFGSAKRVFVPGDLYLWPLTLTFKLIRARNKARPTCEFGANPFSVSRDIWVTKKQTNLITNSRKSSKKTEP